MRAASDLLKPYDARLMRCSVSTRINHLANGRRSLLRTPWNSHRFSIGYFRSGDASGTISPHLRSLGLRSQASQTISVQTGSFASGGGVIVFINSLMVEVCLVGIIKSYIRNEGQGRFKTCPFKTCPSFGVPRN